MLPKINKFPKCSKLNCSCLSPILSLSGYLTLPSFSVSLSRRNFTFLLANANAKFKLIISHWYANLNFHLSLGLRGGSVFSTHKNQIGQGPPALTGQRVKAAWMTSSGHLFGVITIGFYAHGIKNNKRTDRLSRSIISRDKRAPLSSHLFVVVVVAAVLFVELVLAISRYVCVFTFLENIMQMRRHLDRSVDPNPKAIKLRECSEIGLVADRRNALKIML